MKSSILKDDRGNSLTGRSKRNFPLPIFQKEPMGWINEFTYYYSIQATSED
jgi:hypothetical protein